MGAIRVGDKSENTSAIVPGGFSGGYTIPGSSMYPASHLGMVNPVPINSLA